MAEEAARPLSDVKVVELATFIGVPAAGRFLADMGAQVVKIESSRGDNLRFTGPSEGRPTDLNEQTSFDLENCGKKCITLDVRTPDGREVLNKMLSEADVFLTNWRPQALKRHQLSYDDLKKQYPSLVFANVTGYGEKGPDCALPGFDYTAFFARGGISGTLYQKGTVPGNWVPGLGDHQAAMMLAAGILAALHRAKTTGKGDKVSVSLMHAAIYTQAMAIQASQYGDKFGGVVYPMDRRQNANPWLPCAKTKDDRFIQICCPNYDMYYPTVMKAIGREDLAEDSVLGHLDKVHEAGRTPEMYDILQEQMLKKTAAEWKPILTEADIPFSICQTWDEILHDKQAWATDCFATVDYPSGPKTMIRTPVDLEDTPLPEYKKAPQMGENSIEVLKSLGYDDAKIKEMVDNGTVVAAK